MYDQWASIILKQMVYFSVQAMIPLHGDATNGLKSTTDPHCLELILHI